MSVKAVLPKPQALSQLSRSYASVTSARPHHKVVIVGAGTAGVTAAAQFRRSSEASRWLTGKNDIAIIDPAQTHHYQVSSGRRRGFVVLICVLYSAGMDFGRHRSEKPGWHEEANVGCDSLWRATLPSFCV